MGNPAGRLAFLLLLVPAAIETDPAPKSMIHARLEPPPGQSVPRELAVRVRPSLELVGQENLAWERTASCPIRGGEWSCEIPAGRVDLRITGAGVRPAYRWGVVAPPGRTVELGKLRLWRGATISGFVRPDGKVPQHSVQVDLHPLRVGGSMAGFHSKPLRSTTLESTSRPWGFFRFDGISPGTYAILVRELGLPVFGTVPIEVDSDRSVELPKPLRFERLSLSLRITPPKDPYGNLWLVRLASKFPLPEEPRPFREEPADKEGGVRFQDLAPGDYYLSVSTRPSVTSSKQPSKREALLWASKEFRLDKAASFEMQISQRYIQGRVLFRGQPLGDASVTLFGESSQFRFQADSQGEFAGYVKNEDSWRVRLSSQFPKIEITLQDQVRFERKDWFERTEIRVPDTSLATVVVDARGKRVPIAAVQVLDVLGKVGNHFYTNDYLSPPRPLEIVGLKPGPQRLRGAQGDPPWLGEPVEVQLAEGRNGPLLRLVLPDVVDLHGRILPRFGSPAGVRIFAWPVDGVNSSRGVGEMADEDGDFRLVLPGETRRVNLVVLPPGNSLRILQSEADKNRRLEIPVRRAGGTLIVEGPGAFVEIPERKGTEAPRLSIPILLRKWADLQATPQSPGRLVVPNVEPGTYTLCPGDPFTLRRGAEEESRRGCVTGHLEAAGELTLRIPTLSGQDGSGRTLSP